MIRTNLKLGRIFIKLILIFTISVTCAIADNTGKISIIKKINDEIITNIDIKKEFIYLKALNKNLEQIKDSEIYKIAEESLVREKIKLVEIKKYINLDDFNKPSIIEEVILNLANNLKLTTVSEFEIYLKDFDLSLVEVKKKILIEVLWNQLIASKYNNKININEDNLRKKIKLNKLNKNNTIKYDLSEIVFQAKNKVEFEIKVDELKKNISSIGFKNTAIKFSIADSSKLGGSIGSVKENQLSDTIKDQLNKINIGEFTNPLNLGGNFVILFINDKKTIDEQIDEELMLKEMIDFERKKQFENFSQVYFNKIKINTKIR